MLIVALSIFNASPSEANSLMVIIDQGHRQSVFK